MSDIETAVAASRQIEKLLETQLGAQGRGLHEKLNSISRYIPERIEKRARYIASVRNSVLHEDGATIRDARGFEDARSEIVAWLEQYEMRGVSPPRQSPPRPTPTRQKKAKRGNSAMFVYNVGMVMFLLAVFFVLLSLDPDDAEKKPSRTKIELPQIQR